MNFLIYQLLTIGLEGHGDVPDDKKQAKEKQNPHQIKDNCSAISKKIGKEPENR